MFRRRRNYAIENNLCIRRRPNRSFSIPEIAATKKVKKCSTENVESGYFKRKMEWSSCSSIEEMRDIDDNNENSTYSSIEKIPDAGEETEFSVYMSKSSDSSCFTISPSFDFQTFEDFQPIARSTPINHLGSEIQISYFGEEANKFEDFERKKSHSLTDELEPIFLSEQFHLPDLTASHRREDQKQDENFQVEHIEDQNLQLNEQLSASKMLKNSHYSNKSSKRKTQFFLGSSKKSQSNQKSRYLRSSNQISNIKTKNKKQYNSTEKSIPIEIKNYQNISPVSSKDAAFGITQRKLNEVFQDVQDRISQLSENDSAPKKTQSQKKKITKSTQKTCSENQSNQNTESNKKLKNRKYVTNQRSKDDFTKKSKIGNNCITRKRQLYLTGTHTHTQGEGSQYLCSTASKDIGSESNRRSFKTLGYSTQKKDQNLPICSITTLKDYFPLG